MRMRRFLSGTMAISLAVCMVLASAGCKKKFKEFSFDSMEKLFQKHGSDQFASFSEYAENNAEPIPEEDLEKGYCHYLYCEGQEAQTVFENTVTLVRSPYKVTKALYLEYGKDFSETRMDYVAIELFTFASEEEAAEFFQKHYGSDEESMVRYDVERFGEKNGYSYSINRTDGQGGAAYLYKDKLLRIVFFLGEAKNDIIADICKEFGIMNPLKA